MVPRQLPDGIWGEHVNFGTMDAIYVLSRLPGLAGDREVAARSALVRALRAYPGIVARQLPGVIAKDTHAMLAVVETAGLLTNVFPDDMPRASDWRSDWDVPDLHRCRPLGNWLKPPPSRRERSGVSLAPPAALALSGPRVAQLPACGPPGPSTTTASSRLSSSNRAQK